MATWMIVEDEPDTYEVTLAMFEMWGIEGVAFVDGEEADTWINGVDKGTFLGELPELAILDIRLPGNINGPDIGARLRKSPLLGNIAIVIWTSYRLTPDEEEDIFAKTDADRLIYKPAPKFNEFKKFLDGILALRHSKVSDKELPRLVERKVDLEPEREVTSSTQIEPNISDVPRDLLEGSSQPLQNNVDRSFDRSTTSQIQSKPSNAPISPKTKEDTSPQQEFNRGSRFRNITKLLLKRRLIRVVDSSVRESAPQRNMVRQILGGLIIVAGAMAIGYFLSPDRPSYLTNVLTEGFSIALTVFILDRFAQAREERRAVEELRNHLLFMASSSVNQESRKAIERLDRRGWLRDGTTCNQNFDHANMANARLIGVNFEASSFLEANLRETKLQEANLRQCLLKSADLCDADLTAANLQNSLLIKAKFNGANLSLANLRGANLRDAELTDVVFSTDTILPDGSNWTMGVDITRFTNRQHPNAWVPGQS